MGIFDEDAPNKPVSAHVIGQDLSLLSVAELSERIEQLKQEILRIETELGAKGVSKNAAEALFKRP